MGIGARESHVVLGVEDSFNAGALVPMGIKVPWAGLGVFVGQGDAVESEEMRSDRNPTTGFEGLWEGRPAALRQAVSIDGLGAMFYLFTTSYSVSGVGPYVHVFKFSAAAMKTLWLEHAFPGLTTPMYDLAYGVLLQGFKVSASKVAGLLVCEWTVQGSGKRVLGGAAPQDAAPDEFTDRRSDIKGCTATVATAAVAGLNQIELGGTLEVDMLDELDGEDYMGSDYHAGGYNLDLALSGWFDSAETLRGLADGTLKAVTLTVNKPGTPAHTAVFSMAECPMVATEPTGAPQAGAIRHRITSKPGFLADAGASALIVTVTNTVADYAAIFAAP